MGSGPTCRDSCGPILEVTAHGEAGKAQDHGTPTSPRSQAGYEDEEEEITTSTTWIPEAYRSHVDGDAGDAKVPKAPVSLTSSNGLALSSFLEVPE